MTQRSIATVSVSGTLDEKLQVIAAAGFDAVEIFENDLLAFDRPPREVAARCRDLGLSICAFQPFRDFEGMPEVGTRAEFPPRRAQVRSDAGTRHGPAAGLQQRLALVARRNRPRRRRSARIGRARRFARASHRLRGPGLGPTHQRLSRCVGGRASRRPSRRRHHPRQLSYARAGLAAVDDPVDPRRPHFSDPARRRAAARTRCAVVEPALSLLPGAGRAACRCVHGRRCRDRLPRAVVAGNLQRSASCRICDQRSRRWLPFAVAAAGPTGASSPRSNCRRMRKPKASGSSSSQWIGRAASN